MNTNERIARTIQRIVFTGGYENIHDIPAKVRIADNIAEAVIADLSTAGYAIVPREPSKAVLQAVHDGPLMADDHHMDEKTEKWLREMYQAMVATSKADQ